MYNIENDVISSGPRNCIANIENDVIQKCHKTVFINNIENDVIRFGPRNCITSKTMLYKKCQKVYNIENDVIHEWQQMKSRIEKTAKHVIHFHGTTNCETRLVEKQGELKHEYVPGSHRSSHESVWNTTKASLLCRFP